MGRPKEILISRESAARAALAVIDEEGLNGVSIEKISRRINVSPSSLYHHFRDKSELLSEVARVILRDVSVPLPSADNWEENFIELCVATRRSLLMHPHAAPLLLQFFPRQLLLRTYDRAVAHYPFPPEWRMIAIEGAEKLTFGSALFEASALARGMPTMPEHEAGDYPYLSEAIEACRLDEEEIFIETLRSLLAGIADRYKQHGAAGAKRKRKTPK